MKKITKFVEFLSSLSETDWQLLRLTIDQAFSVDALQKRFKISDKDFAKRLGITETKLKQVKRGIIDVDLKFIAKVEAIAKEELEKIPMIQLTK